MVTVTHHGHGHMITDASRSRSHGQGCFIKALGGPTPIPRIVGARFKTITVAESE
jgi:hypothetical protein